MLARLARLSYRRRWLVLAAWVVALVALTVASNSAGTSWSQSFRLKGTDSQAATDLLESRFPSQAGTSADIVFKADAGLSDPAVQQRLNGLFDQVATVPQVSEVASPYGPQGARQISPDGKVGYAEVRFSVDRHDLASSTKTQLKSMISQAGGNGLQVEGGGDVFSSRRPPGSTEGIGLLAAVIILLIAFGSVLAMGLPILTALFGIGVGFAVVELLSHVTSVPEFATQLAAMIGIGVGIDYALFIVTRYRQGLHDGLDPETAVVTALDTAGRAVLFAGTTVVISLLGMLLIGIQFVGGLGVGAAAVVAVTMAASMTLLPALLGFVGRNIDRFRLPGMGKTKDPRHTTGYRWSRFLQSHPWPFAALGLVILIGLAVPVFSIRLGSSDESNTPTTETTRRAYDLKAEGFGAGASGPLLLAARDQRASGPGHAPDRRRPGRGHPGGGAGEPGPTQPGPGRGRHPGHPHHLARRTRPRSTSSTTSATTSCPRPPRAPTCRCTSGASPPRSTTWPPSSRTDCPCSSAPCSGSASCCCWWCSDRWSCRSRP